MNHLVGKKNWILGGEFKLILNLREKKGGIHTLGTLNANFDILINELAMEEISTTKNLYTWENKKSGDRHITSRMDCLPISELILTGGANISSLILPTKSLDH